MLPPVPLAAWADRQLASIIRLTGEMGASIDALSALTGAGLLSERAALNGFAIPGMVSAGGGCRLYPTLEGHLALNIARPDDRDLLPALFGDAQVDPSDDAELAERLARSNTAAIVAHGRELGLAIASIDERPVSPACVIATPGSTAVRQPERPLVIDLSALWAGPLAGNILALAGCDVVKVESRSRPDAMREGDPQLFARLNGGKDSLALDLRDQAQREALKSLLASADVVIEAARPRALLQLGIDADSIVRANPGLLWITITGHGTTGDAANWTGFGDDCGVAGGLSAALRDATGSIGFIGDAIADPLTGIAAARATVEQRRRGEGARVVLAMAAVAAEALADEQRRDPGGLTASLHAWAEAQGEPFPSFSDRYAGPVRPLGSDNGVWLEPWCAC